MIESTHATCNECPNELLCGDQGECLAAERQHSRRIMDKLSVGERFMLLFGRGEYDAKTQRVIPKKP
jgi:hypothetical protein